MCGGGACEGGVGGCFWYCFSLRFSNFFFVLWCFPPPLPPLRPDTPKRVPSKEEGLAESVVKKTQLVGWVGLGWAKSVFPMGKIRDDISKTPEPGPRHPRG